MLELMQELYASGTEMHIIPFPAYIQVTFYHLKTNKGTLHLISSFDLADSPISMGKYIQQLLDNFLKEIGITGGV